MSPKEGIAPADPNKKHHALYWKNAIKLELRSGENWLLFPDESSQPFTLSCKDIAAATDDNFGTEASDECFLCFDVDDAIVTVKDMRMPDDKDDEDCMAFLTPTGGYMTRLPRREMRVLHPGDVISVSTKADNIAKLKFEYRDTLPEKETPAAAVNNGQQQAVNGEGPVDDDDAETQEVPVVATEKEERDVDYDEETERSETIVIAKASPTENNEMEIQKETADDDGIDDDDDDDDQDSNPPPNKHYSQSNASPERNEAQGDQQDSSSTDSSGSPGVATQIQAVPPVFQHKEPDDDEQPLSQLSEEQSAKIVRSDDDDDDSSSDTASEESLQPRVSLAQRGLLTQPPSGENNGADNADDDSADSDETVDPTSEQAESEQTKIQPSEEKTVEAPSDLPAKQESAKDVQNDNFDENRPAKLEDESKDVKKDTGLPVATPTKKDIRSPQSEGITSPNLLTDGTQEHKDDEEVEPSVAANNSSKSLVAETRKDHIIQEGSEVIEHSKDESKVQEEQVDSTAEQPVRPANESAPSPPQLEAPSDPDLRTDAEREQNDNEETKAKVDSDTPTKSTVAQESLKSADEDQQPQDEPTESNGHSKMKATTVEGGKEDQGLGSAPRDSSDVKKDVVSNETNSAIEQHTGTESKLDEQSNKMNCVKEDAKDEEKDLTEAKAKDDSDDGGIAIVGDDEAKSDKKTEAISGSDNEGENMASDQSIETSQKQHEITCDVEGFSKKVRSEDGANTANEAKESGEPSVSNDQPVASTEESESVQRLDEDEDKEGKSSPDSSRTNGNAPETSVEEANTPATKTSRKRKIEPDSTVETQVKRNENTGTPSSAAHDLPAAETPKAPKPTNSRSTRSSRKRKPVETPTAATKTRPVRSSVKRSRRTPQATRSSARSVAEDDEGEQIRILVTGFELNSKQKKLVKAINAILLEKTEDAHAATHVIASDGKAAIRRTPKLMIALCRIPNIVGIDWLVESASAGTPLPCEDFLILNNKDVEKKYNFSMRHTLEKLKSRLEKGKLLLDGFSVYVCPGVAGNKAPPEDELKLIVEGAGGSWIRSLSSSTLEPSKVLIITSDPPTAKQTKAKLVVSAVKKGAAIHPQTWLFQATMTQELDL